jgi:hypothetical protein
MARGIVGCGIGVLCSWLAAAEPQNMPVRSFDRFEFDTVTAHGLWAEVATAEAHDEPYAESVDVVTVEPRLVYGGTWAEGGLFIPYHFVNVEVRDPFFGSYTEDEDGIGDMRLYGKVVPLRTHWLDAGLGLELSFPSGDDTKGFGTGEVGFLPYGMAAAHLGPVDVRAHLGYQTYADSNEHYIGWSSVERAPDSFVYGGGLFGAVNDYLGLRAEFIAQTFDTAHNNQDVLAFEPGFDVRIPLGTVDLFVRPTGAVCLTDAAPEWGVGGAVTLAWTPSAG